MAGTFTAKRGGARGGGGFKKSFNKKRSSPDDDDNTGSAARVPKKARGNKEKEGEGEGEGGNEDAAFVPKLGTDDEKNAFVAVGFPFSLFPSYLLVTSPIHALPCRAFQISSLETDGQHGFSVTTVFLQVLIRGNSSKQTVHDALL